MKKYCCSFFTKAADNWHSMVNDPGSLYQSDKSGLWEWYVGNNEEPIDFCPWCAAPLYSPPHTRKQVMPDGTVIYYDPTYMVNIKVSSEEE